MKLAELIDLDTPLPADPFEALLLTRARMAKVNKRTLELMGAIYPDYEKVVCALGDAEEQLAVGLGSFSLSSEVA